MINNVKGKFAHSIGHIEVEPGDKNRLMQSNDDKVISGNEALVFSIVKKYDLLKDFETFKKRVKSEEPEVKKDAASLEVALSKELKRDEVPCHICLTAPGVDENTLAAIQTLISKNAPAIKIYKETTGIDLLSPINTPGNNGASSKKTKG